MINSTLEYEKMAIVEQKLWWYSILHEKVLSTLNSYKINTKDLILDLGCGTGGLMQQLVINGYHTKGIDVSETAILFCKKKNLDVSQKSILEITKETFSPLAPKAIISNDSLYFFSDSEIKSILSTIHSLLKEDGILIINYPVLEAFRGTHDLSVGIKKRKNKNELTRLLNDSGFSILQNDYWPFLLSPIIFFVRTIQKVKLKLSKNVEINSDVNLPPYIFNKIFYYLTKAEIILPYKPWGSSLFIVARKK